MSDLIRPMLATASRLPEGSGWSFEFKWDGVRAVTYVDDAAVKVMTRNDRDVSTSYPELRALGRLLAGHSAVLDGEIVALDPQGRPDFGELQWRMHVGRPTADQLKRVPVGYFVFDLLSLDGESLLRTPYAERRARLDELHLDGERAVTVPPHFPEAVGQDLLAAAQANGLEGVVAKRNDSIYEPGRRSPSWVKVPLLQTQEVVIGGWKPGAGRRAGTIGSLLLGASDDTGLVYVGHVGTGFNAAMLAVLLERLGPLENRKSPFVNDVPRDRARDAHWTRPELVGEVEFRSWTRDGRLRHSSWRGLRTDKDPRDVRLPTS